MQPLGKTRHNSLSRKDTKAMRKAGKKKERRSSLGQWNLLVAAFKHEPRREIKRNQ